MQTKICEGCGQQFQPRPQTPNQAYCSEPNCQKVRRLRWQVDKRKNDPDYADNQGRAQKAWRARNADYWKNYRATHPEYVEQNRRNQRGRKKQELPSKGREIAKMDVLKPFPIVPSGIYKMKLTSISDVANIDVWIVELRVIEYSRIG